MATVKLDLRDPATKAVVDGWEDDTEYVIRTGEGPNRAVCEVVDTEEEEPAPEEGGAPAAPGPAAVSAAMGG
jgi:hypothetical protein